jgi:hypothetical protein
MYHWEYSYYYILANSALNEVIKSYNVTIYYYKNNYFQNSLYSLFFIK